MKRFSLAVVLLLAAVANAQSIAIESLNHYEVTIDNQLQYDDFVLMTRLTNATAATHEVYLEVVVYDSLDIEIERTPLVNLRIHQQQGGFLGTFGQWQSDDHPDGQHAQAPSGGYYTIEVLLVDKATGVVVSAEMQMVAV